ncbi:SDR family NAD(P)-dependent oxidoreductase [Microbacterium sp. SLBN-146]|uniref:SDR family NAD(P)-dependent oxidoreductase n=1 Tax=Microbacterium sp. SLBN-146 TaxID=2768457 RepID=UPI0011502D10|nr:SDR family oxidoreductase [Microbacterium sp. SLBN-146]TQJ29962.1 3-oxoacyl-[acyl-carrier protein] reductase [Microbacterium sp. SLBN-146]
MDLQLNDRVAVVTGATAGIGRATALTLSAEGAHVALVARRGDALRDLADEIERRSGRRALVVETDILDAAAPARIVDAVDRTYGRIDIVVNAAGAAEQPGESLTEEVWQRQFDLNFHSKRRLVEASLPFLAASGRGRVVNFVGLLEPTLVSAAQAAVAACTLWSKALSRVVAPDGVTVNCIAPGRVDSEQVRRALPEGDAKDDFIRRRIPAGRFGTPEEAAALVAFLVSGPAGYITGDTFSVDGGMHWAI